MLNLTSVFVTLSAVFLIKEVRTWQQVAGLLINLVGILLFFFSDGFAKSHCQVTSSACSAWSRILLAP
jgi:drug/metabolite transporter (DMT)-like permease